MFALLWGCGPSQQQKLETAALSDAATDCIRREARNVAPKPVDLDTAATCQSARLKCLGTWMRSMAASDDPVEYVADAVIAQCGKEIAEFRTRTRAALTSLSSQDIANTLEGQRKTVISGLVVLRLERKQQNTSALPQPQEPKTREGKLADCDMRDAEWRKWVAERGHDRGTRKKRCRMQSSR
jgi:hypothetical protein